MLIDISKRCQSEQEGRLLMAALELFDEKGYNEVSIQEIVERAHVSKSTFYKFYTNKENILIDLFRKIADEVFAVIDRAMDKEERKANKSLAGIRTYIEICLQNERIARLFLIESAGMSSELEQVRREAHERFAKIIQTKVEPYLTDDKSPEDVLILARGIVGAVNEVVVTELKTLEGAGVGRLAKILQHMMIRSFFSPWVE
jgi:AcrR family transcriptional regulator